MSRLFIITILTLLSSCASTASFINDYTDFVAAYGPNHLKIPTEDGGYRILHRVIEFTSNTPPPMSYGDLRARNASISQVMIDANTVDPIYCDYYFNFDSNNLLDDAIKIESSCGHN